MTSTRVASLFVYLSIRIRTRRHTSVYVVRTRETRCDSKKNASRDDSFFVNASWALHRVTTALGTIPSTSRVYRRREGLLARFERRHTSASVDARRARAEPRSRARGSWVARPRSRARRAREREERLDREGARIGSSAIGGVAPWGRSSSSTLENGREEVSRTVGYARRARERTKGGRGRKRWSIETRGR